MFTTNNNSHMVNLSVDLETERALAAMKQRDIDNPESLLPFADPEAIVAACGWWDRQSAAKTGLLVWKIRQGGVRPEDAPSSRSGRQTPVYDDSGLPLFFMDHSDWDRRRRYHVRCDAGRLMMIEAAYPTSTVECDACGFLAGLPHRALTPSLRSQLGLETA